MAISKLMTRSALCIGLGLTLNMACLQSPVLAQISNSDSGLADFLNARGYSDTRVTKRGFTITTLEACKKGEKFKVKVSILGQIKSAVKIGNCGSAFNPQQAVNALKIDGYENIDARKKGNEVVATACRDGRKYGLTFARDGQLIDRRRLGRCIDNSGMTARQVGQELKRQGYNRITFTDDQLPQYKAEACFKRNRVRLELNRRAEIRRERRIGRCEGELNPNQLAAFLESKGFKRVQIVQGKRAPYSANACRDNDRLQLVVGRYGNVRNETKVGQCQKPINIDKVSQFLADKGYDRARTLRRTPPYLVEACQNTDLMELTIGRFGRIRNEQRVGRCAEPMTESSLNDQLAAQGYFVSSINRRNNGSWAVEACRGDAKVALRYSRFGKLKQENQIGSCASAKTSEIMKTLETRGAKNLKLFVEGCFRNNLYRWNFDRLGNRIDRERLGGRC